MSWYKFGVSNRPTCLSKKIFYNLGWVLSHCMLFGGLMFSMPCGWNVFNKQLIPYLGGHNDKHVLAFSKPLPLLE